jgi:hypothetical protein
VGCVQCVDAKAETLRGVYTRWRTASARPVEGKVEGTRARPGPVRRLVLCPPTLPPCPGPRGHRPSARDALPAPDAHPHHHRQRHLPTELKQRQGPPSNRPQRSAICPARNSLATAEIIVSQRKVLHIVYRLTDTVRHVHPLAPSVIVASNRREP